MNENEILIEEFKTLRKEVDSRLKIIHNLIALASIFWIILITAGIVLEQVYPTKVLYNYLLIIPLIFAGLIFNYQDNQRTLEATARYLEENLRPKLKSVFGKEILEWEKWFAGYKIRYQFSSIYKLFALLVPFSLPILLLIFARLNRFQSVLAIIDLFFLIVIIINFRYKLFRVK